MAQMKLPLCGVPYPTLVIPCTSVRGHLSMCRAVIMLGECLMQGRHLRAHLRAQGVGRPMPLISAPCAQWGTTDNSLRMHMVR